MYVNLQNKFTLHMALIIFRWAFNDHLKIATVMGRNLFIELSIWDYSLKIDSLIILLKNNVFCVILKVCQLDLCNLYR